MENRTSEAAGKLLELSVKLNKYVDQYMEQTGLIQTLLAEDDEDSIFKIKRVLNQRDALIKGYDKTAGEFRLEQAQFSDDSIIPAKIRQKLSAFEEERRAVFSKIAEIEKSSMKKVSELYTDNRCHIKQIEDGKKLLNAYQSSLQATDGIFFDRRK